MLEYTQNGGMKKKGGKKVPNCVPKNKKTKRSYRK